MTINNPDNKKFNHKGAKKDVTTVNGTIKKSNIIHNQQGQCIESYIEEIE